MCETCSTGTPPSIMRMWVTTAGWPIPMVVSSRSDSRRNSRAGGGSDMRAMIGRRQFLAGGLAAATMPLTAMPALAFQNSDIRYGFSGQAWMGPSPDGRPWPGNIEEGIKEVARVGLDGIEPFRNHIVKYLDKKEALKEQLDRAGISMVSCSNGGRGMETNFIDPARAKQAVADHVAFARDFIKYFGCTAFKFNMGGRPKDNVMTREHLKT